MVDRKKEWDEFAEHMSKYMAETQVKYGTADGLDLMAFTGTRECLFNIIKYALRNWNGKGKPGDWEKMAHYSQIAWTKQRAIGAGFIPKPDSTTSSPRRKR